MELNENNGTATAVETTETKPVAKKAAPVIIARKVKKGKCGKAGAPLKDIIGLSTRRPKGFFTKKEIFDLNGQTISELCIDQRLSRLMKAKELFRAVASVKHEGAGRPPFRYTFDASKLEAKPKRTRKVQAIPTETVDTAPVVHAEPVQVETPAPAETTAV
jgi:hypothetical protein